MKLPRPTRFWMCLGVLALVAANAAGQAAPEPPAGTQPAPAPAASDADAGTAAPTGDAAAEADPAQATPAQATPAQATPAQATPAPESDGPDTEEANEPAAAEDSEGDANEPASAEDGALDEAEPPEPGDALEAAAPGPVVPRTSCHGKRIRSLAVHGNGRVTEKDVLATLKLKVGMPCTDDELARDARALWDLGFFDDIVFEADVDGDEVALHVAVGEKPAIGKIEFRGHDDVDEEDIDEKVTLSIGEILSEAKVRKQVTKVRDLYAEEGFFLAKVDYRLEAMPNNEVAVVYEITEGPEVSVRRMRFLGNDSVPDDELLQFMRTHATGLFSFLSSDDTFKRDFFNEDILRLQALYFDRGFLEVKVDEPRVELTPDRRQIDITIPITEGPRFRIGRLRVVELDEDGGSVEPLGGRRKVRSMVEAEPGEWFSRTKLSEGVERITRHYRDASFAKVQVEPQTELEAERRIVHVTVAIQRGPEVHIERIQIQGNDKTRDKVIRREILLAEGDKYSQSLLEASKQRITALGYFERVDTSEEDGSEPNSFVLTFVIEEKATGTFQVGAGFSSIEQFILTAQIQQQNLFGHGQSLTLNAQISGLRQLIELQFFEPYLLDTMWSAGIDLSRTRQSLIDFTQKSTSAGLSFGHPVFHRNLRAFLRYRAAMVETADATGGFLAGGNNARGRNLLRDYPIENIQLDGFTSSFRLSLTWDSRNNRIFPTKGIYSSISSEIADPIFGSQRTFIKNEYFGRFYYPLFKNLVLKLNTQVGLVTSRKTEGVPLFERYFLGGIMSLRGFDLQAISPQLGLASTLSPLQLPTAEGFPIGGNLMTRYNLEFEFPIVESVGIKGVIFQDGGNTWNLENQLCQGPQNSRNDRTVSPCGFSPIRFSAGFGVRWFSPLGPLRFEWGIPIQRRDWEKTIRFDFTIGNFF